MDKPYEADGRKWLLNSVYGGIRDNGTYFWVRCEPCGSLLFYREHPDWMERHDFNCPVENLFGDTGLIEVIANYLHLNKHPTHVKSTGCWVGHRAEARELVYDSGIRTE